jgi:nucleoside-triphosphatase
MGNAYLLTGKPRVGKTTIIKHIVAKIGSQHCGGFYTEEILDETKADPRIGFRLRTLAGQEGILAHQYLDGPYHLGRYGIDLTCLQTIGIPALLSAAAEKRLIVIDEIGFMQALCEPFTKTIEALLNGHQTIVGTIVQRPHPWITTIKKHQGVNLYEVRADNRDHLAKLLTATLKEREQNNLFS